MGVVMQGLPNNKLLDSLPVLLSLVSPPFRYIAALNDGDGDAGKSFIAACDEGKGDLLVKCRVAKFPIPPIPSI